MKMYIINVMIIMLIAFNTEALAESASETATQFYDLVRQENYSAAVRYYDPDALREFRQLMSFEKEITDQSKRLYYRTFFDPDLTDESSNKLSDKEYFASFWRGVLSSDMVSQSLNYKNVDVIGEVMEKENLAHVVTRNWITVGADQIETIEVTSFKKINGVWKIRMSGKLKSIAILLREEVTKNLPQ
jgi:hypothetical protein